MESLGLSQKDAQSRNKWRRRIKGGGQPANPGSPGKMAVKTECVYVCVTFPDQSNSLSFFQFLPTAETHL